MKATLTLINGLRTAARTLRDPDVDYYWGEASTCNCGILAQALGIDKEQMLRHTTSTWDTMSANYVCNFTGQKMTEIFNTLLSVGLEVEDFHIIEDMVEADCRRSDRFGVANYFERKAAELELQLHLTQPKKAAITQCVSV